MNHHHSTSAAVPHLRRSVHLQLQLLVLPSVIVLLLAVLAMKGCAAPGPSGDACGPEERASCVCSKPGAVSFTVEGMGCPNCAKELTEVLKAIPGVADAKVCFEDKKAFVTLDPEHPASMETVLAAVEKRQQEHLKLEADPACQKAKK